MDESTEELKANMEKAFAERVEADQKLTALADHLNSGKGTYVTAEQYAYETGKVLSSVFREQITEEKLPEGVFTREFVQETIEPLLKDDHKIVSTMAAVAQENINTAAGVHIQPQKADFNQDRADGFATKMDGKTMEEAGWMLGSPVTNFSQSIVDETMIKNGEVLEKAGKAATIKRQAEAKCCDWCLNKAGTYDATNREAYQRHRECRCEIEMHIDGSVKRQKDWKHNQWEKRKEKINGNINAEAEDNIKIGFTPASTMEEAKDFARNVLGIDPVMWGKMDLSVANMINKEILRVYKEFGDLKKADLLRGVEVVSVNADFVAAYFYPAREIILREEEFAKKNSIAMLQRIAERNFNDGFWSTSNKEHAIRHELGHAIGRSVTNRCIDGNGMPVGVLKEIDELRNYIIKECGIDNWRMDDTKEHTLAAGEYLSYYGLETNSEFIAESVAEYLGGNPRGTAQIVMKLLKRG